MLRRGQPRPLISARWRWWFFRHRRTMGTLLGIIVLVLWARGGWSADPEQSPLVAVVRDVVPAQRIFTAPPGLAELDRQNRSALVERWLGNKVKHSTRIATGEVINCMLPKLDLTHDSNQFAFHTMPKLQCSGKRMFVIRDGKFVLDESAVPDAKSLESCSFHYIKNYDDDFYFYSKPVITVRWPFESVVVEHDFVRIQCSLKSDLQEKEHNADAQYRDSLIQKPLKQFWNLFKWKRKEEDYYDELDSRDVGMEDVAQNGDEARAPRRKREAKENDGDDKPDNELREKDLLKDLYHWDSDVGDSYDKDYPNLNFRTNEFDQFSVQVSPKPEVFQRISKILATPGHSRHKPNVLMIGVNTVSHLAFQRLMPLSYKFLKTDLGAVVMESYNVVGELTKDELIPMLTGMWEDDLPDVQTWKYNAQLMNAYPFIWNEFQRQGYVTLFAEDEPLNSVFNTGFYGFDKAPTDHYMRPFWQAVLGSEIRQKSSTFCTGNHANHQYMLQYVEDFMEKYNNVSRFSFTFFRELSHTNNNPVQYLDADLVGFLKRLKQKKLLEDTIIIVFSDRGMNDYRLKDTVLAKMEERLPLMALAFPKSFQRRNRQAYANVVQNAHRLTTPFDIHETFLDILYPSRMTYRPPEVNATAVMSLFENILINRTCQECNVAGHWCMCMSHIVMSPAEPVVKAAASALLRHVISRSDAVRHKCGVLGFEFIHNARLVLPTWKVLKFTHPHGKYLKWQEFNNPYDLRVAPFIVSLRTSPCGVLYEGTVIADFRNHTHYRCDVVAEEVKGLGVRKYHTKCVADLDYARKMFCCCRDFQKP